MHQPARNLAWMAKHHFGKVRLACFVLCLSPALWLAAEWFMGALGINVLNRLLHFTGQWSLILLIVTLAITPVRRVSIWVSQVIHARYGKRVSDWNWLIRLRRQLGLFTFFYASLHVSFYAVFDAGFDLTAAWTDVVERPFIGVGLVAFALLVPLALTSNRASIRKLGRQWRTLHMATYAVALLAVVHFWMSAKVGDFHALPYTAAVVILLGARAWAWRRGERQPAKEVSERHPGQPARGAPTPAQASPHKVMQATASVPALAGTADDPA